MRNSNPSLFVMQDKQYVECTLCPHHCKIGLGKSGLCGARSNRNGSMVWTAEFPISAVSIDPMEKKPFYHLAPGSSILSVGLAGCNLFCPFCQNYELSRYYDSNSPGLEIASTSGETLMEGMLARLKNPIDHLFPGLAFTYSEPVVYAEWILSCSELLAEKGYKTLLVTNGYTTEETAKLLAKQTYAANVDLKAFTDEGYRKLGGSLAPVLRFIGIMAEAGVHLEITTLLVPGINDTPGEAESIARFISGISRDIPLHFSRYFPKFRYHEPPTPVGTIERAVEEAKPHLNYIYTGNLGFSENTVCPKCGEVWVDRSTRPTVTSGLKNGKCAKCGTKSPIILR